MRKKKKQKLLELADIVLEGIERCIALAADCKFEDQAFLLAESQNGVVEIGSMLEQSGEEVTDLISRLEELCELFYICSTSGSREENQGYCKEIREKFIHVQKEMRDMKETKLVVFLPYKASMWDSLESIWREASKDSDWISVVIPIPYYAKRSDGTLGEQQYEGEDFPEYVPVMDWQDFSLEQEHPDIIFIHNPYDQCNYVTTIHPFFYSSRIRKYTDKLVYIPYFIHQNDRVPEDYCVLPGVIYSDVVVLQSEKVKEQYIQYYKEALPELAEKLGEKGLDEKFQAWGSPKYDAANETESLPDSWKKLLEEGNEKNISGEIIPKKVIFFNTHLSSLMQGKSGRFLKKLKWVFEFFRNRNDVVMLWRPHPLSVETARSMNPEAVEPYLQIVEWYKKQGFGIYDDSKALHRAVNLSDAYYGDHSSVTELFRHQGKPVMIMDHEIMDDEIIDHEITDREIIYDEGLDR